MLCSLRALIASKNRNKFDILPNTRVVARLLFVHERAARDRRNWFRLGFESVGSYL